MKSISIEKSLPGIILPSIGMGMGQRLRKSVTEGFKTTIDFLRYLYLAAVMILLLIAVVELKHHYQIDLIPGVDTPVDNAYFAGKEMAGVQNL